MYSALASTLPPVWQVSSSFGYFVGLAGALGSSLAYVVVTPRAELATASVVTRASTRLLAGSGFVLLIVAYLQLAARTARGPNPVSYYQALVPARMWALLRTSALPGEWVSIGTLTLVQNIALLLGCIGLIAQARPAWEAHRRRLVGLIAFILVLASAVRSVPRDLNGLTLTDIVDPILIQGHIIGGTTWIGGLAFVCILAVLTRTHTSDLQHGITWEVMWRKFSTLALVAVGVVLISGLWLAWKEFGHISQLWDTTYGRFLLVKIALVAGLLVAGGYNQLVLMPKIAAHRSGNNLTAVWTLTLRHFPRVVAVEAAIGLGVLLVVPFLFGSPRKQAGDTGTEHTVSWPLLALATLMAGTLAASFIATVRASDVLAANRTASLDKADAGI